MNPMRPRQEIRVPSANESESTVPRTVNHLKPVRVKTPSLSLILNAFGSVSVVVVIILLFRLHRAVQQRAEASPTLLPRDIQLEQLRELASILDRLSETDVEDLLASRGRLLETGSSIGSSRRSQ